MDPFHDDRTSRSLTVVYDARSDNAGGLKRANGGSDDPLANERVVVRSTLRPRCCPLLVEGELEVVEARVAAVGGEVDGTVRRVVDDERVAVHVGEPG